MYSLTTPPGPIPTTITTDNSPAVDKFTIFEPPPIRKFDPNFNIGYGHRRQPDFPRPHQLKKDRISETNDDHVRAALPDLRRDFLHPTAHAAGESG